MEGGCVVENAEHTKSSEYAERIARVMRVDEVPGFVGDIERVHLGRTVQVVMDLLSLNANRLRAVIPITAAAGKMSQIRDG